MVDSLVQDLAAEFHEPAKPPFRFGKQANKEADRDEAKKIDHVSLQILWEKTSWILVETAGMADRQERTGSEADFQTKDGAGKTHVV
jgi:hypothetical protein